MPTVSVLESQQSAVTSAAARAVAGCWTLAAERAVTLRPHQRSVLQVAHGGIWLTVSGSGVAASQDRFLHEGEHCVVEAGQCAVLEAWPCKPGVAAAFRWDAVAAPRRSATPLARPTAQEEWQRSVVQPWAELACRLRLGWQAARGALFASGRLVAGLARYGALNLFRGKGVADRSTPGEAH